MRIVISDYSGHPFQIQLARALARRGHEVLHISSASFQTPKGSLGVGDNDAAGFSSIQVVTKRPFAKQSFVRRRAQEIEIGQTIGRHIQAFRPDIVVSSNAPLDTQRQIQRSARQQRAAFVFWVQDLYSTAIASVLTRKFGFLGKLVGAFYRRLEGRMLAQSDHVVVIAADFINPARDLMGRDSSEVSVIENWAPLDEITQYPRDNAIAKELLPDSPLRIIYSGTLGFKHDPSLLADLARSVSGDVCVFSEGPAADSLRQVAGTEPIRNLKVAKWLPFDELPQVLAGADVLVVILEPDAGVFSVPSKVLTYMCVGRPILASMPPENLAAVLIRSHGAGLVVPPGDRDALIRSCRQLAEDAALRQSMGENARAYAENAFAIDRIVDNFETVFDKSVGRSC